MRTLIVVFTDPDTRKVEIDFPIPEGGELSTVERVSSDGRLSHVLPFASATREQRAHYVFWSNGARERVNKLIQEGRGAGLRQTLRWLLEMRVNEAYQRTGYKYALAMTSNADHWLRFKSAQSQKVAS